MTLEFNNRKQVEQYILEYGARIEKALILALSYMVAELENHAKLNKEYKDQTSNLRTSIGGVVLKNGKPITYKGFEGSGGEGAETGTDFINSLIPKFSTGYAIILVAGMDYASYVEEYYQLNVLKKSELRMMADLPAMLNNLKSKL